MIITSIVAATLFLSSVFDKPGLAGSFSRYELPTLTQS
jgi:hypothetical protein